MGQKNPSQLFPSSFSMFECSFGKLSTRLAMTIKTCFLVLFSRNIIDSDRLLNPISLRHVDSYKPWLFFFCVFHLSVEVTETLSRNSWINILTAISLLITIIIIIITVIIIMYSRLFSNQVNKLWHSWEFLLDVSKYIF